MSGLVAKRWASVVVTALLIAIFAWNPMWMLEYRAQDTAFQRPGALHPDIMIVGIDDHTLAELGPFHQWSRTLMGEAIHILNRYDDARPAVIAIDVLYTEQGLYPEIDAALVDAVAGAGNVVLASKLLFGFDPETFQLTDVPLSHQQPFPALLPHVRYGLVNGTFDRDGIVRNALLHKEFEGETLYSFPMVVASMYTGMPPAPFVMQNNETFIRYAGMPGARGDFFTFSFSDIFEEYFDPMWTADAIVLIGPYATGMMDHYHVPINHRVPMFGVEIHANVLQVILDEAFKLRLSDTAVLLIVSLLLIAGMAAAELLDIRLTLALFLAAGVGYYFFALWLYSLGYVLPILAPPLALGLVFLYQLILQAMEKAKLRSVFKKYVDPKLVDHIIKTGQADSDEVGCKKHIAVLFVDVRGFTPMTEKFRDAPERIVETLNEYLELTSSSVFNNGGSVDKFIGDATMALFNGFVPLEDYVYKAVKAAWDMVEGAAAVNASIKERIGVDIGFGVGVHCGEAIVGNLGPSFRKDYTAIGDAVNTAARLESSAGRSQVLISRDVYEIIADRVEARSLGEIPLKGKSVPLEIFALTQVR